MADAEPLRQGPWVFLRDGFRWPIGFIRPRAAPAKADWRRQESLFRKPEQNSRRRPLHYCNRVLRSTFYEQRLCECNRQLPRQILVLLVSNRDICTRRGGHDNIGRSRRASTFIRSSPSSPLALVFVASHQQELPERTLRSAASLQCAMPHSTSHSISTGSHMRAASQTRTSTSKAYGDSNGGLGPGETEKFPDFDPGHNFLNTQSSGQQRWQQNGFPSTNGDASQSSRWHARRDSRVKWAPREPISGSSSHSKTSSISNAVHRMRSASMGQNAHELAEALRAPFSWKLIVCSLPPL